MVSDGGLERAWMDTFRRGCRSATGFASGGGSASELVFEVEATRWRSKSKGLGVSDDMRSVFAFPLGVETSRENRVRSSSFEVPDKPTEILREVRPDGELDPTNGGVEWRNGSS